MTKIERYHPYAVWGMIIAIVAMAPMAIDYRASSQGKHDRDRLVDALTQTDVATIVADDCMEIIHKNPKAELLFGEDILSKRVCDLVPAMYAEAHEHGVERWQSKGGVRTEKISCEIVLPDGTMQDVLVDVWATHCNGEVIFVAEIEKDNG